MKEQIIGLGGPFGAFADPSTAGAATMTAFGDAAALAVLEAPVADRDHRHHRPFTSTGNGSVPGSARDRRVAVLLPCRNEEVTIAKVVTDFRAALPGAAVYVYDNASTDRTAEVARNAGAVVRYVPKPGKGNVLRRMFAEVDAEVYVLADGDDTYEAGAAPQLVDHLVRHRLDMVVGTRVEADNSEAAYRRGHRLGNQLLTRSVHWLFGDGSGDMLSGYRVFSRRYVKSFPAFSHGFETETEMTVHALELGLPFDELPTEYRDRPTNSASKLRTIPDGIRILSFILLLCRDYRPARYFGALASGAALVAGASVIAANGHLGSWTPATIVAAAFAVVAVVAVLAGIILDSLGRSRREIKRLLYLAVPSGDAPLGSDGSVLASRVLARR